MRIALMIAVVLPMCCLAQDPAPGCAIEQLEKPVYPPLARMAHETGAVEATATIAADGSLDSIRVEGKPILTSEIRTILSRSKLDTKCVGQTLNFRYQFFLEGDEDNAPHTVVQVESPATLTIRSNPTGIICILRDGGRRPWIRRVFHQ